MKHYTQANLKWDERNIAIDLTLSADDILNILDELTENEAVDIIWEFMQHHDGVYETILKQFEG